MADPVAKDEAPINMDKMTTKVGRFALTTVVAKRAKDVKERQSRMPEQGAPASPVLLALRDIARGRAKIVRQESEQKPGRK